MRYLIFEVGVSFFFLAVNADGILPLPGLVKTVLKWAFGRSLLAGVLIFGSRFIASIFGR